MGQQESDRNAGPAGDPKDAVSMEVTIEELGELL
jgi:hypothetical protein